MPMAYEWKPAGQVFTLTQLQKACSASELLIVPCTYVTLFVVAVNTTFMVIWFPK